MKVIIPVAGKGARLKPHTFTHPKALIPLAGKPILGHILDKLVQDGFTEFVLVLGYLGEKVREYVSQHYSHCSVEFVYQAQSEGIGHAIWLCSDMVAGEQDALIVLGDSVLEVNFKQFTDCAHTRLGVKRVDDPSFFGVVESDPVSGNIRRLVEKPSIPKSNIALVGLYYIRNIRFLMSCLDELIERNSRSLDEFQLTDALQMMLDNGEQMDAKEVHHWFDCGKKEIVLETNAVLLRRLNKNPNPAQFENTILVPPVSIHPSTQIRNSIIGPNVSVGEDAVIENSIISQSIIGGGSRLGNMLLKHSLIGNDSSVYGNTQSLNIGDSTEINFAE